MRLGITIMWRGATIASTREIATKADQLGFEYLWITEAWGLEALSTTGYLLGLTSKIKLGIGVLNVYSRSAALIGMACATLDQIALGRFVLGLGSSGKGVVERWHGGAFSKPIQRTKEYVEIVRRVARGDPVDYTGEISKLSGLRLYTRPMQRNQEIYVGAIGDKNLELAGEICDGAIVTMYPCSRLSHALESLEKSNTSGKARTLIAYLPVKIAVNAQETQAAKSEIARNIAFYVASMGKFYAKNLAVLGFGESVQKILDAYTKGGSKAAAAAVDDQLIHELALLGNLEEIHERLLKLPKEIVAIFSVDSPLTGDISGLKLDDLATLIER
jgi:alkanesulfonate monooxygenase SsuD/methylene tetrahydromethanopterin reductase-like flavin-dependent oxidoreductase (luciferase family)